MTDRSGNYQSNRKKPPFWADKFLEWYCRTDLLEEIQGDAYELFYRKEKESIWAARSLFVWNVLRFFRWKNIRKGSTTNEGSILSAAMIKNILKVALRNFMKESGNSMMNVFGLSAGFTCAFLILLWVTYEYSFDRFHQEPEKIFKVMTHVDAASVQTFDVASSVLDVSTIPAVNQLVSVSTGTRWPHELCFRPESKLDECIYFNGVYASENLFSVFNFPILEGDRNPLKQGNTIAISERMAHALFGSSNPLGKSIKIDGNKEVIIASVFKDVPVNSSIKFDFAMPFSILKKQWGANDNEFAQNFFEMYIKAEGDVSAEALTSKLNDVRVITEAYKQQKIRYEAYPLTDWRLKSKFEGGKNAGGRIDYIILFTIIGSLVVIMAVINFVNMSTARATLRSKEIGIRKVTGALKGTIVAQFFGESFLVVLFAFCVSVIFTQLALPFFNSLIDEQINLSILSGQLPFYLLAFLSFVTLLAGLYPALVMSSFQPIRSLKNQISNQGSGSQQFRKGLLVLQLSISICIIIFSGVLYQQLSFISSKDLGFDRSNTIRVEPTYRLLLKFESFKNELFKNSSIISAAASNSNPLQSGGGNTGVSWKGKPSDLRISFSTIGCTYEFPETIGLRIKEGRNFLPQSQDSVRTEALVTEDAVKVMGLKDPVGEEIKLGDGKCVIIGVVNNFHTSSLHESRLPAILFRTNIEHTSALYIKYRPGTTQESMEAITSVYKKFEPSYTMKYWFQDETFNKLYKTENIASRLVLLFTTIALIIATVGIAGLATFNTLRKTREIGIRRVFGASMGEILALLTNEFSSITGVAIVIAAPVSWYVANLWLSGFVYHTDMPWWVFGGTLLGVGSLIALITMLQGLKTISTNPSKTLRSE